ncbi:BTB/POZ domain-containing protein [Vitis vinifera]|uniref:BTB/POZ domain-containing protein n=1 Tax=Vitis vinifera TaxID=29760 RepID=A0A438J602_VITVI|nr:BTB/POZ domain-containing protein [Vitis vinifera]
MKFMKLGSRPDTFYTTEAVRSVSSEISSDLIVQVKGSRYMLHKFPLLSKCLRLQRLCSEFHESAQPQIVQLPDFPGGVEAFELCAKFCYGITITLSAFNIVSARCAAEYLQMTEDVEKGNLIYKLEVFFNSCILHGWKDSIVTLQSTKSYPLWSEDLGITSRCIEAIASRVLSHPSKVNLSHSYSRRGRDDLSSCNGTESLRHRPVSKGWWAEDIAELGIDLYWRTIIAIKSGGKVPSNLIGDALKIYASRWLPNISKDGTIMKRAASDPDSDSIGEITSKHRQYTQSFLFFQDGIGQKNIVMIILEQFMLQGQSPPITPPRVKGSFEKRRSRSAENVDFGFQESRRSSSASHSSKLRVAKLVDGYLQEIARDVNLPLSKMIALAEAVPDFARLDHDDLYRAIDIYLKAHPDLSKSERKRLCRILDCKKLSVEACMHAAQNELLPLRVVVQVLFFEQARAAMAGGQVTELPNNIKALLATHNVDPSRPPAPLSTTTTVAAEDQWSISGLKSPKSSLSTLRMKLAEDDDLEENDIHPDGIGRSSKLKALCSIPTRPKRMLKIALLVHCINFSLCTNFNHWGESQTFLLCMGVEGPGLPEWFWMSKASPMSPFHYSRAERRRPPDTPT